MSIKGPLRVSALQDRLDVALGQLRRAGTDLQDVEVKKATGGLPQTAVESVSAFANSDGGMLILDLDEAAGFVAAEIDAAKLASDLASACADQLEPPIRPDIDIAMVDGRSVVVAVIEGLPPGRKPCYVKSRGMDRGSYIRTHDGDRRLGTYDPRARVVAGATARRHSARSPRDG